MLLLTILCLLMMCCSNAWSQEREDSILIIPNVDDYLQAFVEAAAFPPLSEPAYSAYSIIPETYSETLFYLYPNIRETPFADLYHAYSAAQIKRFEMVSRADWVRRMVEAWITENAVDLSTTDELTFEDFFIDVIPRDFDADGVDEYLLDITKGGRIDRRSLTCLDPDVSDYLVVRSTTEGYRFIETGLPWKGSTPIGRYSYSSGGMYEMLFEDLTADGLPEWVLVVGGETAGGPGMGYADGGGLLVLNWRDNGFQYVVPSSYSSGRGEDEIQTDFFSAEGRCDDSFPVGITWEFSDIDADAPREILQSQRFTDNWSCTRTETKFFDWDATDAQFRYLETTTRFETDTQNCAQKDAEALMWEGDYEASIPIYERALELETYDLTANSGAVGYFNYERSLNQYLRARLAFAYLMTGQPAAAAPILDALAEESPEETTIGLYIEALNDALHSGSTPIQICSKVYTLFASNFTQIRVGYTGDELYYANNPYLPERIGCDAPILLQKTFNDARISTEIDPTGVMAELGIGVLRELETDLDGDGQSEWIVWAAVPGVELSFVPDEDAYDVSLTEMDRFLRASDMALISLPGEAGSAIAITKPNAYEPLPWAGMYSPFGGGVGGGPAPSCSDDINITVSENWLQFWRWESGMLDLLFARNLCGDSLDLLFSENNVINVFTLAYPECIDYECNRSQVIRSDFRWDEAQRTFVENRATPEAEPTAIQPVGTPNPYPQYYSVLRAFEARDFEAVVGMTTAHIEIDPERDVTAELSDYYLRALALDALERSTEAWTILEAIREAAPESLWGRLAALHLS